MLIEHALSELAVEQVWGSWWSDGQWGYACCHQTVKNSYCTGEAGESAAADAVAQMEANMAMRAADSAAAEARTSAPVLPTAHKLELFMWLLIPALPSGLCTKYNVCIGDRQCFPSHLLFLANILHCIWQCCAVRWDKAH